ncbi:hypothetical protein C8F04DRAFT_1181439 [Mycena alexandri]|uniref:Uncharacterized protein n=1 Tax=Mycena alexandri TaxID=1745969 RepID=A0AAD6X666_9AGAR|nr:hypothetical protein C8F04DRAFT_1181439 [Mycena alexandri]
MHARCTAFLYLIPLRLLLLLTHWNPNSDTISPNGPEFSQWFGARGISVLTASGDGGVRGNHDDLTVCNVTDFIPVFPASCPFVTAVRSTQPRRALRPKKRSTSPVAGSPTSSLLNFPARRHRRLPQDNPIHLAGTFNKSGRGYPDVAVQGWNFEIVAGGETGLVGGTRQGPSVVHMSLS